MPSKRKSSGSSSGRVALVGAGPGDPGLLTERGAQLLRSADVVLYDRLVDPRLLDIPSKEDCERIYVGKEVPGRKSREGAQKKINDLMVLHAREGRSVVRLKGGDPYIFGRGGEEGLHLAALGIPFEVVPGVTAAIGAAATAGIPFTHRGVAGEVTFATAHEADGGEQPPWEALGKLRGTIVFYMGTYTLAHAAERLIAAGRPPETPVAVIERATTARQRTVTGTLSTIAEEAKKAEVKPPSLVVVGDVVRLRPPLNWFEKRPLFGKRILVSRPRETAGSTRQALEAAGAEVTLMPALSFAPPTSWRAVDQALGRAFECDWIVLTSPTAVRFLAQRLEERGLDGRALAGPRLAAIGDGTAAALRSQLALRADLVPEKATAEGLVGFLGKRKIAGKRFILLRADKARETLPALISEAGGKAEDVVLYRLKTPDADPDVVRAFAEGRFHALLLSSGEIARNVHAFLGVNPWPAATKLVTIGPVTSDAVRELGWKVDAEAATPANFIDAVVAALSK